MPNYNKVILMGNITRDIELRHTPTSNTAVAQVGLAVNRKWRDQNTNEMKEEVTFVDCDAFGKTAENIAKFFSKGRPIFIEGRLRLDTWKDKTDGSNRSKLKVIIESWDFIDSKPGGGGGAGGGGSADGASGNYSRPNVRTVGAASQPAAASNGPEEISEDDIPF